jgi:D-amino-acid dehydrogenase
MKIAVLGGGVIGVTAAYYLNQAGHEVTVLERQAAPALETSFANAGEVSPGYSAPWAGPGVPFKAIKWLLMHHRPLVLQLQTDPAFWRWIFAMLGNCTAQRYQLNKSRMVRLAEYSRDCLRSLRKETGVRYDERMQGTLQLFRTTAQLAASRKDIEVLRQSGVAYEVLDVNACTRVEPALARVREKFVGGLRLPGDETGDCHQFTQALAQIAAQKGVTFRFGVEIERLEYANGSVTGVRTNAGMVTADAYLVALGSYSPLLTQPLGLRLPVYPVKGYSITVPITDPSGAPESTVMDETHKVAITRLGDRIRVGGMAELAGYDLTLQPRRRETLTHVVSDLFGSGGDIARASFWCGLRPMTPDGTPIVGATPYPNLFLSTGHGTLGWTMAAGSGKVIAHLMSKQRPDIETNDLGWGRY